ncbi:CoA pyrophosphatase [Algoriphagus kandeliae]|uniref:CoA pyrophosphatase n=1 Tax=Algoriphagus kandeliae TaxID=2562278 RepID=A0A4Y9R1Q5_9BACT|nr:CoA pyrophosphatase [Algoriphagus kandeliae]TFV97483.1 CoA pyrophosphatase [Algoriphagus kandeliae]
MTHSEIVTFLQQRLASKLPGQVAHLEMAPQPVDMRRFQPKVPESHRKGAVLLLLYPSEEGVMFPLIKRPVYPGVHSGQIALPGGKMDQEDSNIIYTALREAEEEVAVNRERIEILGQLSDLYIPTSNFLVTPVLGSINEIPQFVPEEREVDAILPTGLDLLLEPSRRKRTLLKLSNNLQLDTPYFDLHGEIVWGATAMILSELVKLIQEG